MGLIMSAELDVKRRNLHMGSKTLKRLRASSHRLSKTPIVTNWACPRWTYTWFGRYVITFILYSYEYSVVPNRLRIKVDSKINWQLQNKGEVAGLILLLWHAFLVVTTKKCSKSEYIYRKIKTGLSLFLEYSAHTGAVFACSCKLHCVPKRKPPNFGQ